MVTGRISTVAGTGQRGFGGDGGPATQAQLDSPRLGAIDTDGNLLIADTRNQRIRLVQAGTGIITTAGVTADQVAGDGGGRFSEGVASAPSGLAVDNFGGLFVADPDRHRVIRLDQSTGDWTIMAGGGLDGVGKQGFEGDGGLAINALLSNPIGVAVDNAGNLFIADSRNHRIRRLDRSTGKITTVVGTGSPGFSGDGGQGVFAQLNGPSQVALDQDQNLLISDSLNNRIRQVNAKTGVIETIAGSGNAGFDGDEGPATGASLNRPTGVAVDSSGNLFISDMFNRRIRRVDAGEAISTIAGVGSMGFGGDQGPATHTLVYQPAAVALDRAGNIFIADLGNQRIRRVDVDTGAITTVAGTGQEGFGGDGGPATEARLANPSGVAVDAAGNLYIADWDNHRIRRVDAVSGLIFTVAGAGENGAGGDGGPATRAQLSSPRGVAVDDDGNFYIADTGSDRILRVDAATGIISTVAGSGKAGLSGDGGPATGAQLDAPIDVAVDHEERLFIADLFNRRIRRVDPETGIISTVAAIAEEGGLASPSGIAVDQDGNLFIADQGDHRIRRIDAVSGIMTTVAGDGHEGFAGDGAAGANARLSSPRGVAVDSAGNVFIADSGNHRIRAIKAS